MWTVPFAAYLNLLIPGFQTEWNVFGHLVQYGATEFFCGLVPPLVFAWALLLSAPPFARFAGTWP